jgi:hypothetical protein
MTKARIVAIVAILVAGCHDKEPEKTVDAAIDAGIPQGATAPVEWVGFHTEVPFAPADFHALASGLFGTDAQAGTFTSKEISPGFTISSSAETATPTQSRVTFVFNDGGTPRTLAIVPASFAVGTVFVQTIDVALAKMQADEAAQPGSGESWFLQYQVQSPMGGTMSFGVRAGGGVYTLVLDIQSPQTSLIAGNVGMPANVTGGPVDSVIGTVNFHLTKDQFDYFSDHAYGQGATGAQNFNDFPLEPHTWLRLTVTPDLPDELINVGFQVLLADGTTRIDVAKAPASILAGDAFRALVDRNVETMLSQETALKGSSTPWTAPFFYNQPSGGGVVQVVAQGQGGIFFIAYAVQTPLHSLTDVPFVAWKPVTIVPDPPTTCDQQGYTLASQGTMNMTFTASSVILNNPMGPLTGTIYCSIYHATDVDIDGPKQGAISVQDFNIPNADLSGANPPTFVSGMIYAGDYQVLCFQDRTGSGNVAMNDPVTLPIGSFPVACNQNPTAVQFGLLDPQP